LSENNDEDLEDGELEGDDEEIEGNENENEHVVGEILEVKL